MSSLNRIATIAFAIVFVGCGKGDVGKTPTDPTKPTVLPPTISVSAQMVQASPFKGLLQGEGSAKYSDGGTVTDGFSWSINDTVRAVGTVLRFTVQNPGSYNVCLVVASQTTCETVTLIAPVITYRASLSSKITNSKAVFPKSLVSLQCIGTSSLGESQTSDFVIKLNDQVVGVSASLDTVLGSGDYRASCTVKNSPEDLNTFTIEPPTPIMTQVFVNGPTGERTDIPMKVCAEGSGNPDCIQTNTSGLTPLLTSRVLDDSLILTASCQSPSCGVMPSTTILRKADYGKPQIFNTAVSNWVIQIGRWMGRQVPISMTKAYALASGGVLSFFIKTQAPDGTWGYQTSTWNTFPIFVGVDTQISDTTITDDEITLIKNTLPKRNADFGFEVFRFGIIGTDFTRGHYDDGSVYYLGGIGFRRLKNNRIANVYNTGSFSGATGALVTLYADKLQGAVGESTVGHELVHAFGGVGHAPCLNWIGIMTDCQNANPVQNPLFGSVTPEEVAYIQIMYAIGNSQKTHGGYGIPQMDQGERRSLGLPLQQVQLGQFQTGVAGISVGNPSPMRLFLWSN